MQALEFLYGAIPFVVLGICFIIPVEQSKKDSLCIAGGALIGFMIALILSFQEIIHHVYLAALGALIGELIAYLLRRYDERHPGSQAN